MKNIKMVVFDWAGTMVDYGCMGPTQVFIQVFSDFGIQVTTAEAREPMGLAKKDHVARILDMPNVSKQWNEKYGALPTSNDVNEIYLQLAPKMENIVSDFATVIPGVVEVIDWLKSNGVKVGSTTGYVSSMMEKIVPIAQQQGLFPDMMVNPSDCKMGRPAPYMIFENAHRLGVYPLHHCVKIGDTVADVQEGLNAGMWVIGITRTGNEVGMTQSELAELSDVDQYRLEQNAAHKLKEAGAHFTAVSVEACKVILEEINQIIGQGLKP